MKHEPRLSAAAVCRALVAEGPERPRTGRRATLRVLAATVLGAVGVQTATAQKQKARHRGAKSQHKGPGPHGRRGPRGHLGPTGPQGPAGGGAGAAVTGPTRPQGPAAGPPGPQGPQGPTSKPNAAWVAQPTFDVEFATVVSA